MSCPGFYDEECGIPCGDEGRLCEECSAKEFAEWRSYFGIRPGMTRAERLAQLDAMDPRPVSAEQMDEWRNLK